MLFGLAHLGLALRQVYLLSQEDLPFLLGLAHVLLQLLVLGELGRQVLLSLFHPVVQLRQCLPVRFRRTGAGVPRFLAGRRLVKQSLAPVEFTSARLKGVALRLEVRVQLGRRRGVRRLGELQFQDERSDADLVAVGQRRAVPYARAVEKRAGATLHIAQQQPTGGLQDRAVCIGDVRGVHAHVAPARASHDRGPALQCLARSHGLAVGDNQEPDGLVLAPVQGAHIIDAGRAAHA